MFSKIFFVLATVCVINASVISDNVFDDDPETEVASNPKGCNIQACHQLCRRIKQTGGVCFNGRCKCDRFLNAEDEISENTPSDLEGLISLKEDDPETEVASNPKGCNIQVCHQLCRRIKLSGGACVNGRCKCDNFLNAEDEVSEKTLSDLEDSVLQTDDSEAEVAAMPIRCKLKICDRVCRWRNMKSGACVDGRCKCAKSIIAEGSRIDLEDSVLQTDDSEAEAAAIPKRCNLEVCNSVCHWRNKTSGACVDGRCKCAKSIIADGSRIDLKDSVLRTDDSEAEAAAIPKRCNLKVCNSVCHWRNKTSGACVDGRCKCAKSIIAEDDSEAEVAAIPVRCNLKVCDKVCRWLNKTSGACVDGRCKCAKSIIAEDAVSESNVEDSVPSRACKNNRCNQLCRKRKFRGGSCVGANCYCHKFLSLLEDNMTDPAESLPLSPCNFIACDRHCRKTGWRGGVCIKGQCKCDHFLNAEVAENSHFDLEDSVSPRKCNHQECNANCRKLLFREGVCFAGRCSCNNYFPIPKDTMNDLDESISLDDDFLTTEDEVSQESSPVSELSEDQTVRGCNPKLCDQLCRKLKLGGGTCVNGRCKCDKSFGTEDAVDEYSELATRRCRLTKCNRTCTRRGYEGATCINGRCKCYNKTQAEDAVDEYSELATRGIFCNLTRCNQTCTRRGYVGGRCVFGWCKCYNKIQRQDASASSDVTSVENEESNVSLTTNEEELTVPSPSACNTVNCNQMCHRLRYAGGWCRFGRCQCY